MVPLFNWLRATSNDKHWKHWKQWYQGCPTGSPWAGYSPKGVRLQTPDSCLSTAPPFLQVQQQLVSLVPRLLLPFAACPCPRGWGSVTGLGWRSWGWTWGPTGMQWSGGGCGHVVQQLEVGFMGMLCSSVEQHLHRVQLRKHAAHPGVAHKWVAPTPVASTAFSLQQFRNWTALSSTVDYLVFFICQLCYSTSILNIFKSILSFDHSYFWYSSGYKPRCLR